MNELRLIFFIQICVMETQRCIVKHIFQISYQLYFCFALVLGMVLFGASHGQLCFRWGLSQHVAPSLTHHITALLLCTKLVTCVSPFAYFHISIFWIMEGSSAPPPILKVVRNVSSYPQLRRWGTRTSNLNYSFIDDSTNIFGIMTRT
jgi:hypothetical protein